MKTIITPASHSRKKLLQAQRNADRFLRSGKRANRRGRRWDYWLAVASRWAVKLSKLSTP